MDDDEVLCRFLTRFLGDDGFHLEVVHSGSSALEMLRPELDLVILDLNLPGMDGLAVLEALRCRFPRLPVLVLTGRSRADTTVVALNSGADDCLIKPFLFSELLARTRALLRRTQDETPALAHCGNLTLNRTELRVTRDGIRVDLTPREYGLLERLMRPPGVPVSRSILQKEIWGDECTSDSNVVDVYIKYLRDKIDLPHLPRLIRTVRGTGYVVSES